MYNPASTYDGVCAQLRSSMATAMRSRERSRRLAQLYAEDDDSQYNEQYWTDRTYGGRGRQRSTLRSHQPPREPYRRSSSREPYRSSTPRPYPKKCYICGKPGCWSTKHPMEERRRGQESYRQYTQAAGQLPTPERFYAFLAQYEGVEGYDDVPGSSNTREGDPQLLSEPAYDDSELEQHFSTSYGQVNGEETVSILNEQAAYHAITKVDVFEHPQLEQPLTEPGHSTFVLEDRYEADSRVLYLTQEQQVSLRLVSLSFMLYSASIRPSALIPLPPASIKSNLAREQLSPEGRPV